MFAMDELLRDCLPETGKLNLAPWMDVGDSLRQWLGGAGAQACRVHPVDSVHG